MPVEKRILASSRLRRPPSAGFSWIDRRFLRHDVIRTLRSSDFLLYFFLCAVADKDGLSFYGDVKIANIIGLQRNEVERSRGVLERSGLILYRAPLYQVLSLPEPVGDSPLARPTRGLPPKDAADDEPCSIGSWLRRLP